MTTTARPATDLGHLLHKNPARVQSFELSFGKAHVFYPEASEDRCTMALLLDVDPVGLVRGRSGPSGEGALEQYVNDRPYVASSFLTVAISRLFGTALSGRSKERPELVDRALPFEVRLPVVPCRGGEPFLRKLFEPLGYQVEATTIELDPAVPAWGTSRYLSVTLRGEHRLADLLSHVYVLVPVLDDDKHYWVGDEEVEKLVRHGEGWLATHPEKEHIAHRYLAHQKKLACSALEQLVAEEAPHAEEEAISHGAEEAALEKKLSLNDVRLDRVAEVLAASGAKRVLDLGCGEGKLLRQLLKHKAFEEIVGLDVSHRALETAAERLRLERMSEAQQKRLKLLHGSLTYRDARLAGYDAAAVVEVVEHLDPPRLAAFERVVFESARPGTVVLTTPNVEYNVRFENLPAGRLRHKDHRFEWTRAEFEGWATGLAARFGYAVRFEPLGPVDEEVGAPTQMAVFTR
ncbi:MAG: 3' terminal RNA ribose 2'-O-methyltransferase Hen1 [Anaeromyxobacteraceae bacterium]